MFLVDTSIFMDKNADYVDVTYLWYFMDLDTVKEWNWGTDCLVYLYQKLNEASSWRTRQQTSSATLLTVIFIPTIKFNLLLKY